MTTLATLILGPIELTRPEWLALGGVALVAVILVGRKSLSAVGSTSRRTALAVRILVTVLLTASLCEPALRDESEKLAVTAVIDMSRSVPTPVQAQAETFVEEAAAVGRRDRLDLLGAITVTREAKVQGLPSLTARDIDAQGIGSVDGTNLESAVRTALAVRPTDAAYRLLLVTDGNETEGSLLAAAESARALGVPVDVLPLTYRYDSEVIVEAVDTPASARMGEVVNARVTLRATAPTRGRLLLLVNGEPVQLGEGSSLGVEVDLDAGANTLLVPLALNRRGPQEIEAVFEPLEANVGDAIAENNRASSITFFSSEGRVLVVSNQTEESFRIVDALESSRIGVDTASPELAPSTLVEFNAYDAIVLCNVPAYSFSEQQLSAIKAYVEDSGGGLVMTGGPEAFGAGGWIGTTIEEVLPVQLDPPQTRRMPRGALALIMHSVEMPEGRFYGEKTAEAAVDALSRLDLVGIVEYNWSSGTMRWVYEMAPKGDGSAVRQAIKRLTFGDMQNMAPSVEMAYDALAAAEAGQKHAIIISDGDPSPPGRALLQKFADAGITISTVGVFPHMGGPGSPDLLRLRNIAEITGGSYYGITTSRQLATLPQIFIKEAQTVKRSLIWEGPPFAPSTTGMPSTPMRGISAVPALTGYVVTADRQDGLAVTTIRGPENDPIMAQWQRGLGRVVAFTGDVSTRWAADWTAWPGFDSFWAEHIRWAMRPSGSAEARTRIETDGDRSTLIVDLTRATGERVNFATIVGRVAGPTGEAQDITLRQEGPGRYVAEFEAADPGSYVVGMRYEAPATDTSQRTEGSIQAAVTKPFTDEFRALEDNAALLRQIAERTGGRVLPADPQQADLWSRAGLTFPVAREPAFLAAILLTLFVFLIDVAVRRVRIDLALFRRVAARAFGRSTAAAGESLESLKRAQARAQSRMSQQDAKDAMQKAREAAATKFEADATQTTTEVELGDKPAAVIQQPKTKPNTSEPKQEDEDAGLSRLMKAKKRAQDEMQDD
ncbi:MAG: VWA domain-containing protein [Planctomycetota bacterium]